METPRREKPVQQTGGGSLAKRPAIRHAERRRTLWYATLLTDYQDRILPVDLAISEAWGKIQAQSEKLGTPMATIDGLLAATAMVRKLLVVTRNEKDFLPSCVSLLNPWLPVE